MSKVAASIAVDAKTKKAQKSLDDLGRASVGLSSQFERLGKSFTAVKAKNDDLVKGFNRNREINRGFRHQMANTGYQLQDLAVQLQGGQSALLAFTQQGSQFVSAFGAKGAVVGAILAIGGAVVGALVPSLMKGTDHVKDMEDALSDLRKTLTTDDFGITRLSEDFLKLGATSEKALMLGIEANMIKAKNGAKTAATEIAKSFSEIGVSYGFSDLSDTITALNSNLHFSVQFTKGYKNQVNDLSAALGLSGIEGYKTADSIVKLMASMQKTPTPEKFKELQASLSELAESANVDDEVKVFINGLTEMIAKGAYLSASYQDLNEKSEQFKNGTKGVGEAVMFPADAISELSKNIARSNIELTSGVDAVNKYNFALENGYATFEAMPKSVQALYQEYVNLQKQIQDNKKAQDDANKAEQEAKREIDSKNNSIKRIVEVSKEQLRSLQIQTDTTYESAQATAIARLETLGASEAVIADTKARYDNINAIRAQRRAESEGSKSDGDFGFGVFQAEMDSLKARANSIEESLKSERDLYLHHYQQNQNDLVAARDFGLITEEKYNKLSLELEEKKNRDIKRIQQQAVMAAGESAAQSLGILADAFGEGSAMAKAAFVANQALAISNAIINAELAYSNAMANIPAPFNLPIANTVKALGYASAGVIAGQTLASFEGGGITFSGVRSGGIDGKGGRMAVVHPNEKITDLEKGGGTGQPVNVQFTINAVDAKGIDQLLYERRGMITGIVQKAVNNVGRRIM